MMKRQLSNISLRNLKRILPRKKQKKHLLCRADRMLLSRTNRNQNQKLKRQKLNLFPMLPSVVAV